MTREHFNRSLPQTPTFNCIATVKWQIRVKKEILLEVTETLPNGGGRQHWYGKGEAIVIRRSDVEQVHDYARVNRKLRDFLVIRLPMKIGLRTSEITTLNIEDINFETRSFQVLDSKKKQFYPLPLDVLTLQYIKDLIGDRKEGNVFIREENWKIRLQRKPLSRVAIWYLFRGIGLAAGVKGFNPRIARHYFACKWHEDMKKTDSTKTIVGLQRILRHTSIATTTFYLARLVFFEDIQQEFNGVKNPYVAGVVGFEPTSSASLKGSFYEEFCSRCVHEPVCNIKQQMCSLIGVSGCRFYKQKKEMMKIG